MAQFTYVIRKRIKLSSEQALWVFVETEENGKKSQFLPPTRCARTHLAGGTRCSPRRRSHTMATTYHEYKDKDQFLYITYSGENVFGGAPAAVAAAADRPLL